MILNSKLLHLVVKKVAWPRAVKQHFLRQHLLIFSNKLCEHVMNSSHRSQSSSTVNAVAKLLAKWCRGRKFRLPVLAIKALLHIVHAFVIALLFILLASFYSFVFTLDKYLTLFKMARDTLSQFFHIAPWSESRSS